MAAKDGGQAIFVAGAKRFDHFLMFLDRAAPFFLAGIADKTDALHPRLQQIMDFRQSGIAGCFDNCRMYPLVELVIVQPFPRTVMRHHPRVQVLDTGNILVGRAPAGLAAGQGFKFRHDIKHVADLFRRKLPNHRASARPQNDQPFAGQHPDRFPHRRSGNAHFQAELGLVDLVARCQTPLDDHIADPLRHQLVQRLARNDDVGIFYCRLVHNVYRIQYYG